MVLEIAEFLISDGQEDRFVTAYREAVRHVAASAGFRTARLVRGIENPSRFTLLVEWERLEDHVDGFRSSQAFVNWRAAVGPYFAEPPRVEHAVDVGR